MVKAMGRLQLLLMLGFVSYGLLSALLAMLEFRPILHGGGETFLFFAVAVNVSMGGRMEAVTEFIGHVGTIVGFVGTATVWALFGRFVHGIIEWLDGDRHAFDRFKRR